MQKLNITVKIDPQFDRADWNLYDIPGADDAAKQLNASLKSLVNSGKDNFEVFSEMQKCLESLDKFGASDTEPRCFLGMLMFKIFGNKR